MQWRDHTTLPTLGVRGGEPQNEQMFSGLPERTSDLGVRVLINAQMAAPLLWAIPIRCPKNCTHCYRRSGVQFKREATPARTYGQAAVWVAIILLSDGFLDADLHSPG